MYIAIKPGTTHTNNCLSIHYKIQKLYDKKPSTIIQTSFMTLINDPL